MMAANVCAMLLSHVVNLNWGASFNFALSATDENGDEADQEV